MSEAVIQPGLNRSLGITAVQGLATVGAIAAGAALVEAALVPGILIGGAALLASRFLPRLGRTLPSVDPIFRRRPARVHGAPALQVADERFADEPDSAGFAARFGIGRAVAKTITFRTIVTSIDFTVNYIVLGEFAVAAGLSAFALAVGPVLYLIHEAGWNRYGPPVEEKTGLLTTSINVQLPQGLGGNSITLSRALAKTVTFRTMATIVDFSTNYAVVQDLATATLLTSSGFVLGPFVYFGHEMAWDRFAPASTAKAEVAAQSQSASA
jgi:uncharacterized membrane protein